LPASRLADEDLAATARVISCAALIITIPDAPLDENEGCGASPLGRERMVA
jgi:hypothetical protein